MQTMSIFLVFLLIAFITFFIASVADSLYNRWKNQKKLKLFRHLSKLAEKKKLIFSSQELFHQTLIGLDGVSQKLLVASINEQGKINDYIIDIRQLRRCSVKTVMNDHHPEQLSRLMLEFELSNGDESLQIPIYTATEQTGKIAVAIHQKAKLWEMILQKMTAAT